MHCSAEWSEPKQVIRVLLEHLSLHDPNEHAVQQEETNQSSMRAHVCVCMFGEMPPLVCSDWGRSRDATRAQSDKHRDSSENGTIHNTCAGGSPSKVGVQTGSHLAPSKLRHRLLHTAQAGGGSRHHLTLMTSVHIYAVLESH